MIFGAGENQTTLIDAANRLGYRTVAIDPNADAPGKDHADVFVRVGARDYEATREVARRYGASGIVTGQMENPLPLMARLAEEEGYIFPSVEVIRRCRDKFLMKQAFQRENVPCARGLRLRSDELTPSTLNELRYPLIIKPVDAFSSRGVFRIERFEDIERYLEETLSFSSDGTFIVEEFIDGDEFSVESITYEGQTSVMQITRKVITPFPHTIEMAHIQPAGLPAEQEELVRQTTAAAIAALGIRNSASHAEVKLCDDRCYVIEIGARIGGDFIGSLLLDLSTGASLEEAAVQVALGREPQTNPRFEKHSMIRYFGLQAGSVVRQIDDWSDVLTLPGIKAANLFIHEGMTIPPLTDSAKRSGYVIAQGDSADEVSTLTKDAVNQIRKKIHLETTP